MPDADVKQPVYEIRTGWRILIDVEPWAPPGYEVPVLPRGYLGEQHGVVLDVTDTWFRLGIDGLDGDPEHGVSVMLPRTRPFTIVDKADELHAERVDELIDRERSDLVKAIADQLTGRGFGDDLAVHELAVRHGDLTYDKVAEAVDLLAAGGAIITHPDA